MTYLESFILGIVQGLTEFLPISSSGHLVIFQKLFGISSDNISFEIFVHFGTLLSVVAVYYLDLWKMIKSFIRGITHKGLGDTFKKDSYFRLTLFVIVGTIPAVFTGLFLKDFFISIFHNVGLVGITLIVTGLILLSTGFVKSEGKSLSFGKALLIGVAQMFAILPGISRSGFTISTGLFLGVSRVESARFSFLLAVPAILGAMVLQIRDFFSMETIGIKLGVLLVGLVVSFIVGYVAIRFLLRVLQSGKFIWFAPYCFLAGLFVLVFLK